MNNNFTNTEIFILLLLLFTILLPFRLINKSKKLSFVNPLIIYSLIVSYYCLITPIFRIITNTTADRGIDFRSTFIYGWLGALVSVVSLYFGYFSTPCKSFVKYRGCNLDSNQLWKIGFWLNNIGILGFILVKGINLSAFNPFINEKTYFDFLIYKGSFKNYLFYFQDFLISRTVLMITSFIRNKKKYWELLLI